MLGNAQVLVHLHNRLLLLLNELFGGVAIPGYAPYCLYCLVFVESYIKHVDLANVGQRNSLVDYL